MNKRLYKDLLTNWYTIDSIKHEIGGIFNSGFTSHSKKCDGDCNGIR